MFDVRSLPDPAEQPPRRVHTPRPRLHTWARLLGPPVLLTCHWSIDHRASVPHIVPVCPLCEERGAVPQYGQGYFPALIQQLLQADSQPTEGRWQEQVLMLPEDTIVLAAHHQLVRRDWRGVLVRCGKSGENRPTVALVEGREDASRWPAPWDVMADLRFIWREYLKAAALYQPLRREADTREPGEEG